MKILHIITTINRGGAENHLKNLAVRQAELGHKVQVAYLKGNGYWLEFLIENSIPVYDLRLNFYGDLMPALSLYKVIKGFRPDIIHAHMPPAEIYANLAFLFYRKNFQYVVTKHNDERFCNFFINRFLAKLASIKAKRIIAISNAVKKYQIEKFAINNNKLQTIHYGLDATLYSCQRSKHSGSILRESWGCNDSTLILGCVARLTNQKNHRFLIDSFASFLNENSNKNIILVFVGTGELEEDLKSYVKLRKVQDNIIFTGFIDDIPAVMNAIDCLCLTSRYEGFGLVLLEAMATSLPIIATNVSAIPEIVVDGKSGVLVEVNDMKAMVRAMQTMESKSIRAQMGAYGYSVLSQNFSLDKMIVKTFEVYVEE